MEIDEQLEDAFEAAFAEDEAAVDDSAPAEAPQSAPDYAQDEDDYDDASGAARGEPATRPSQRDTTLEVFQMLREPTAATRGQEAPAGTASRSDAAPAPDPGAAYKKEVYNSLTEDQKERYACFMRSALPRPKMKKLMQSFLKSAAFNDKAVIAMCGISKLFVGELVEMARICASQEGHTGALLPRHVHRAYQELDGQGKLPHRSAASSKRVFR